MRRRDFLWLGGLGALAMILHLVLEISEEADAVGLSCMTLTEAELLTLTEADWKSPRFGSDCSCLSAISGHVTVTGSGSIR